MTLPGDQITQPMRHRVRTRASAYKAEEHRVLFQALVLNPPRHVVDGVILRRTGDGASSRFWVGYDGIEVRLPQNTQSKVAYMAGRFRRHLETIGRMQKVEATKCDPISGKAVSEIVRVPETSS